jgi:hypothetical protein
VQLRSVQRHRALFGDRKKKGALLCVAYAFCAECENQRAVGATVYGKWQNRGGTIARVVRRETGTLRCNGAE